MKKFAGIVRFGLSTASGFCEGVKHEYIYQGHGNAEGGNMPFVILVVWFIVSIVARAFEVISTADAYIGMTILLAAIYIECAIERKK